MDMVKIIHDKYSTHEKLNIFEKIYYKDWKRIIDSAKSSSFKVTTITIGIIQIYPNHIKEISIIATLFWIIMQVYIIIKTKTKRESFGVLHDPYNIL